MEVAGVVVQEVKSIERQILSCEDMLLWSHLYHRYFDFLSNLCQGRDDDELPLPIVAGCLAKVLFVMLHCSTYVQLDCAA